VIDCHSLLTNPISLTITLPLHTGILPAASCGNTAPSSSAGPAASFSHHGFARHRAK